LREAIEFKVVNVMDKFAMKKLGKFDVIFSRNMLIYFDDASRKEVAMTYYELLKPRGYVFLGHAESMSRIVSVFKTKKVGDSIVYQKG
jgi:chemotaxis protein methyltransferase CheR